MNKAIPKIKFSVADWICILICSIPAYYLLGHPAIYIWDEAVYVNASWDMAHGASWLVPVNPTYNTKPPLVLWLQALSLKVIPSAEWAVRLPSALAVSGILLMLQFALKRWGFDIWTRCVVLICFVSNEGFIRHHIGRTGDLDAVMSFFMTAYAITLLDAIGNAGGPTGIWLSSLSLWWVHFMPSPLEAGCSWGHFYSFGFFHHFV